MTNTCIVGQIQLCFGASPVVASPRRNYIRNEYLYMRLIPKRSKQSSHFRRRRSDHSRPRHSLGMLDFLVRNSHYPDMASSHPIIYAAFACRHHARNRIQKLPPVITQNIRSLYRLYTRQPPPRPVCPPSRLGIHYPGSGTACLRITIRIPDLLPHTDTISYHYRQSHA